jgi:hypothetical protein
MNSQDFAEPIQKRPVTGYAIVAKPETIYAKPIHRASTFLPIEGKNHADSQKAA